MRFSLIVSKLIDQQDYIYARLVLPPIIAVGCNPCLDALNRSHPVHVCELCLPIFFSEACRGALNYFALSVRIAITFPCFARHMLYHRALPLTCFRFSSQLSVYLPADHYARMISNRELHAHLCLHLCWSQQTRQHSLVWR